MEKEINKDPIGATDRLPEPIPSGAECSRETETPSHGSATASEAVSLRDSIIRRAEEERMRELYPTFDPDAALEHPILGALLRGESTPTLRQLFEATHMESLVEARVQSRLDAELERALSEAIPAAVATAVAENEERLLAHIRARGQRPVENGTSASVGIRMHPAVDRLTRRERAMLAERAERGESVRL